MNEKFTRDMYLVIIKTIFLFTQFRIEIDRIDGVMVVVLPSGIVDRGFETPVCQTKDFMIFAAALL